MINEIEIIYGMEPKRLLSYLINGRFRVCMHKLYRHIQIQVDH